MSIVISAIVYKQIIVGLGCSKKKPFSIQFFKTKTYNIIRESAVRFIA